jgi:hypothetical protein
MSWEGRKFKYLFTSFRLVKLLGSFNNFIQLLISNYIELI